MFLDPMSAVISALKRDNLIPDVLPESFNPSMLFSIAYPGGKEVLLGNQFQIAETTDEPSISFMPMSMPAEQADSEGEEVAYTLVMLDPDVPSRADPQFKTFRHWVVSYPDFVVLLGVSELSFYGYLGHRSQIASRHIKCNIQLCCLENSACGNAV